MKIIDLRRHTDNDGDRLSDEGEQQAHELTARLSPPYALFVSTGAGRTTETVTIWRDAVGDNEPIQEEPRLRSDREDAWRDLSERAAGGDVAAMREVDPEFVREQASFLAAALRSVFDRLPDGASALVCGHSPTSEAAVYGLTGTLVGALDKGAGVRVVQRDDGDFGVEPLA